MKHIKILDLFLPVTTSVICSLICLCSKVAYIANNMDADQTVAKGAFRSGFIVFISMIKYSLKCA